SAARRSRPSTEQHDVREELDDRRRDLDRQDLLRVAAVRALMRRNVAVIAAGRNLHVIGARDEIVRGIEAPPAVRRRERFDPRVRCARTAGWPARRGHGVTADVARWDPNCAAETKQQMREVLAHAARLAEDL